jgi:putative SOS response-associated peptidase YedK
MCGKYSQLVDQRELVEEFDIHDVPTPDIVPTHHVNPTDRAPIVRMLTHRDAEDASAAFDAAVAAAGDDDESVEVQAAAAARAALVVGARALRLARWWLVPRWSSEPKTRFAMFNARSEEASNKPAYRGPWRDRQRAVAPSTGWFEWAVIDGAKVKHVIRRADGGVLAPAALWERWQGPDGAIVESYTLLTVAAPPWLARVHDRCLVLLDRAGVDAWLDASIATDDLRELLVAPPEASLVAHPVDPKATGLAAIERAGDLVRVA